MLELLNKVPNLTYTNILAICGLNVLYICLMQSLMSFTYRAHNVFWRGFTMLRFMFHNIFCTLQCSRSCERGVRTREAFCMNNLGRHLPDRECRELPRVVTQSCNEFLCPSWSASEWSEVMNDVKLNTPLILVIYIKIRCFKCLFFLFWLFWGTWK